MMSLRENLNFYISMTLSTFIGLKNPVLNFVNLLSSRVLLSYKSFYFRKKACIDDTIITIHVDRPKHCPEKLFTDTTGEITNTT